MLDRTLDWGLHRGLHRGRCFTTAFFWNLEYREGFTIICCDIAVQTSVLKLLASGGDSAKRNGFRVFGRRNALRLGATDVADRVVRVWSWC